MPTTPQTPMRSDPILDLSNNLTPRRRRPARSCFSCRQPADLVPPPDWISRTPHAPSARKSLAGGELEVNLLFGVDISVQQSNLLIAAPSTPQADPERGAL